MKPDDLETWKSVQCEACHGPMGSHPDQAKKSTPVTRATCVGCHDPANSPQFDYESYRKKVSCVLMTQNEAPPR